MIIAAPDFEDAFGSGAVINTSDIITVNGIQLRVKAPGPIYSGELVAAYIVQARKGHENAF